MSGVRFELNQATLSMIEEIGKHMPGGFFIYRDEDPGELIYANKACFRIFGCDGEEDFRRLTGYTFRGLVHPEDYDAVSASIPGQIRSSEDAMDYVEYRIVRKDGSVRWVDDYGHYTDTEQYGGVYCVFISDITEKRQRMQTDLAVRQAVIEALSDSYHTVWLINDIETESFSLYRGDIAGKTTHSVPIQSALQKMKYSEAKEAYIQMMVSESDQERLQRELSLPSLVRHLEEDPHFNLNYLRTMEDGTEQYFRIEFAMLHMPGGRTGIVCGFKNVDRDVRRGLAQQQALRKAEEHEAAVRQRALEQRIELQKKMLEQEEQRKELDSMITAMASDYRSVYHVDLDQDSAVCYRADEEDSRETPVGVHFPFRKRFREYCERYVDKADQEEFLRFVDPVNIRAALSTEIIIAFRYLAHRNGRDYYEMLRMAGVRHPADRDDHIVHAVGVGFTVIDAEMRQTMERSRALQDALAAAEQANRAKTVFLSNMSHEIRTPMNAIIGLNDLALKEENLPESIENHLRKIGSSAHHLLDIINDILDMSRIESGHMLLRNEAFSFTRWMEQINAMIGEQCRNKGLTYTSSTVGQIEEAYIGDEMKLRQVALNLLGNAVKFTPEGGRISFRIEEGARYQQQATLRLIVADTGIGMSEEFLPHIFEAFSQEDATSTNKYGSTGLGMAITRSIVELMNGRIDVQSRKGEGTVFSVTVTLGLTVESGTEKDGRAESAPSDTASQDAETVDLRGRRILLAEDISVNAEIMSMILGRREMQVDIAENGRRAVELFTESPEDYYDAVLMDMRMPEMDGLEATRRIRACERADASAIPIIALTANAFDEDVQRSMQAGLNAHLSKPVEPDTLFRTLEVLIGKRIRSRKLN